MFSRDEILEAFEEAKQKITKIFPPFTPFMDEIELEFYDVVEGWDIQRNVKENKIKVNLYRLRWYLEREKVFPYTPKFDLETALIHDLFEYCFIRFHSYPEDDHAINYLTHQRARLLENMVRKEKGLKPWI